jgi:3-methyladenine DNA glycosylase Tag
MAIPERIVPATLADYLEIMTRAVFQAGLSWALIESKWDDFRREFHGFDPERIAALNDAEIAYLSEDAKLLRSRKKVVATVENAKTMLALEREFGGFVKYLRSFTAYDALRADLRKRFKYVGDISVYYFLFRVGEPVPPYAQWATTVEGVHPRVREMLALGGDESAQRELAVAGQKKAPARKRT